MTDDPKQFDYAVEGPRQSQHWARRYLLFLQDVTAVFDGFKALDIEDLGLGHRELRVVVGPNGAGKTTMCDVISGMTKPTTGKVFFGGEEVTGMQEAEIARRGVGRKFQVPNVFDSLTVRENMLLALPEDGLEIGSKEHRRTSDPRTHGRGGLALHAAWRSLRHAGGRATSETTRPHRRAAHPRPPARRRRHAGARASATASASGSRSRR